MIKSLSKALLIVRFQGGLPEG